jgi:hypothetical protein
VDPPVQRHLLVACDIPRPNFAFGDYFLKSDWSALYGHRQKGPSSSSGCSRAGDVLKVGHKDRGTLVAKTMDRSTEHFCYYHTFAYVSTLEPLGVFSTKSS